MDIVRLHLNLFGIPFSFETSAKRDLNILRHPRFQINNLLYLLGYNEGGLCLRGTGVFNRSKSLEDRYPGSRHSSFKPKSFLTFTTFLFGDREFIETLLSLIKSDNEWIHNWSAKQDQQDIINRRAFEYFQFSPKFEYQSISPSWWPKMAHPNGETWSLTNWIKRPNWFCKDIYLFLNFYVIYPNEQPQNGQYFGIIDIGPKMWGR